MKVLVYDDNPDFGGHQIMACYGIEALAADPAIELSVMHNPFNQKLVERLSKAGKFQSLEAPCSTRRFQGIRNRIDIDNAGVELLRNQFQRLEPDLILCIQGDIEQASQAVLAAKKCRIECVSYIAIPHRLAAMGAKFGTFRDSMNRYLFNKPSRYITISNSMEERLRERRTKKPITVVNNGIEPPPIPKLTAHDSKFTIAIAGRIEFKQKQQDFFVRAFMNHPAMFANCRVLIIGSGPDEDKLKKMIKGNDSIALLPWKEDMEDIYEVIDMLAIPSRYEGVPLVMLEALARGIPVIGSRRDGMQDVLPETWTFTAEDSASMATTFSNVRETWTQKIDALQHRIIEEHSLETFKENFVRAVTGQ